MQTGLLATQTEVVQERTRADIQALRGWAVLTVVVYHSGLMPALKAGYLGVDIFFVVSGYLITALIRRAIVAGTFTFAGFYARRAKRLLPAAYVVLSLTAIGAIFVLPPMELREFFLQFLGATTLTSNIVLWTQTGYFAPPAAGKPLLHMWSLSLEEQFYLLVPAALVLVPRRMWFAGAVLVTVSSLVACIVFISTKPGAVFYLLPTRAWELAIGSLAALWVRNRATDQWLSMAFWPAVIGILVLPFLDIGMPHPGAPALLACLATCVILLCGETRERRDARLWLPARLGDISYSLYLVHWPLFALAANAWVSEVPSHVRMSLLVASFALAALLHAAVELPCRATPVSRRVNWALFSATLGLVVAAAAGVMLPTETALQHDRRGNLGLGLRCEFDDRFEAVKECRTSDTPAILVWGDSQAMHLLDAIVASSNGKGVLQATKSTCGPLLDVSVFRTTDSYNRAWAERCIEFNRSVLRFIASTPSVEVVVLSSWLMQYTEGNRLLLHPKPSSGSVEADGGHAAAVEGLKRTVDALRTLGKRVVLVSPAPSSGFDVGRCLERSALGLRTQGADTDACAILRARHAAANEPALDVLATAQQDGVLPVIRLESLLCDVQICATRLHSTPLYADRGHLSHAGSRALGVHSDLGGLVWKVAR